MNTTISKPGEDDVGDDSHSNNKGEEQFKHPLEMKIEAEWGQARAGRLKLPHFECETPIFMPVGTQGTVKGLTVTDLEVPFF